MTIYKNEINVQGWRRFPFGSIVTRVTKDCGYFKVLPVIFAIICSINVFASEVVGCFGSAVSSPPDQAKSKFKIFDATLYSNKPDLLAEGLIPLNILYAGRLWGGSEQFDVLPEKDWIQKLARDVAVKSSLVVLDVESWPLTGNSIAVMEGSVNKYVTLLNWVKEAAPELRVGYFAHVPVSEPYKSSMRPDSTSYKLWQSENDRVKPIAAKVDAAFPDVYTYSDDREIWSRRLVAQVAEARRLFSGPIYLFLWPQYFDHQPTPENLRERYLPPDFWRYELEMAREYADGIVIWGGWGDGGPQKWNPDAQWWKVTRQFAREICR